MQSLIDQLPDTDKDIQARKDAEAAKQQPADAPSKEKAKPDRWGAASKFTGPDPELTNKLFEQALAKGREGLLELARLIHDPASPEFKSFKAEYFFHGLVAHVSAPARQSQRKLVAEVLASQLPSAAGEVRAFFVRELRLLGDSQAVPVLAKLLNDENLCADAVAALTSIGSPAARALRDALPGANGKCRLNIIQALGALRDKDSVPAVTQALTDSDMNTRVTAAWSLARIADAASVQPLLNAADVKTTWERVKATQACLLLAENLAQSGNKSAATTIYERLRATRTDPSEAYIREIATKALGAPGLG